MYVWCLHTVLWVQAHHICLSVCLSVCMYLCTLALKWSVCPNVKPACTVYVGQLCKGHKICHEWEIGMDTMFVPNTCYIPHT